MEAHACETRYPTDLNDAQWKQIEKLIPPQRPGRVERTTDMRAVVNAIFYLLRSGCAWRMLPKDFPPWQTVYEDFARWRDFGTIEKIHEALRAEVRRAAGREAMPSAGIIDSQSVKTTEKGGFVVTMPARK